MKKVSPKRQERRASPIRRLSIEPLESRSVFAASPFLVSLNGTNPEGLTTNADVATFTAVFSENVSGVDASDFVVDRTGDVAFNTIKVTPLSGSVYRVTVNGITGDGTLGLGLVDNRSIRDVDDNKLDMTGLPFALNPATHYAAKTSPSATALADFNGDGLLDVVDVDQNSASLSLRFGNADGTFQALQTISIATGTSSTLAVGDFNGDNRRDILLQYSSTGTAAVLLGNGDGTFQVLTTAATATLNTVALGDLNGDGATDLVLGGNSSNVSVQLGNGNGTFKPATSVSTTTTSSAPKLTDFDNDGKLDLVVVYTTAVGVFLGNGDGTFQARSTFATEPLSNLMVVGDFNADGTADIVAANNNGGAVSVLLGNGDGTFRARLTFGPSGNGDSMATGDFNGDGKLDLMFASITTNSVRMHLGNGDGTFQAPQSVTVGRFPRGLVVGDLNADGLSDLVLSNANDSMISVVTAGGKFSGDVYTIDRTAPVVNAIQRVGGTSNDGATSVSFTVTFNEAVTGVDAADFALALSGTTTAALIVTAVNSSVYTVTIGGIAGRGSLGLNLVDDGSIRDVSGNRLSVPNPAVAFKSPTTAALGFAPFAFVADDFNGDGKLDLAITQLQLPGSTLSVLLGNGNGTFLPGQSYATGSYPRAISAGDVNNDGYVDLVTSDDFSNTLSVLLGNGDGTFKARRSFATGINNDGLALGDFNNDTKLDALIIDSGSSGSARLMLGNGNGDFQAPQLISTGIFSPFVTTADFNSDGQLDFIIGNTAAGTGSIFNGNGDGTFRTGVSVTSGSGPTTAYAVGDLNGDGRIDIASVVAGGGVSVFLRNVDNSFTAKTGFTVPTAAYSISIADFDGDGKLDIAVASGNTPATAVTSIFAGNGDGSFEAVKTFAVGTSPRLVTGDLNGDGRPDLITIHPTASSVSVLLNDVKGSFTGQSFDINRVKVASIERLSPVGFTTNLTSVSYRVTFSGDVTGVTAANFEAVRTGFVKTGTISLTPISGSVYVVTIDGISGEGAVGLNFYYSDAIKDTSGLTIDKLGSTTTLRDALRIQSISSPYYGAMGVASADINGDGKLDVVLGNYSSIKVMLGNGNGTFRLGQSISVGDYVYGAKLADFNGDGKLDLAVVHKSSGRAALYLGNGNGTFQTALTTATVAQPQFLNVADFNGDGKLDLLVGSRSGSSLTMLLGNGNGTFAATTAVSTGGGPKSLDVGDFNSDGILDLAVAFASQVMVMFGNGSARFPTSKSFTALSGIESIAAADIDGDGKTDLVVGSRSNGLAVYLSNGNGTFRTPGTYDSGRMTFEGSLGVADLDADGRLDLVYGNDDDDPIGELVAYSLSTGGGTFAPRRVLDSAGRPKSFAFGDFDGDGRLDVFVSEFNRSELYRNGLAFRGADFTIDARMPEILSIERVAPQAAGNASTVAWIVTFGEAVTGVDAADFVLAPTGSFSSATIDVVQLTNTTYRVSVGGIVGSGTLGLNLVDNRTIRDSAGNYLSPLRASPLVIPDVRGPYKLVSADLDADGKVDLVYTNVFASYVAVLLGNGDGTFKARQSFASTSSPDDVRVADLNGDGKLDVIIGRTSSSLIDILFGNGDGTFQAYQNVTLPGSQRSRAIVAADFNHDGKIDLVTRDFSDNATLLLLGNGNGTFQVAQTASTTYASEMTAGDVNNDGHLDLVFDSAVSLGNGDGTFQAPRSIVGYSSSPVVLHDFNGDGKLDLTSFDSYDGVVNVFLGNGNGTFGGVTKYKVGLVPHEVAAGDVNGDGMIDLAVTNGGSNTLSVLLGNGNGTFQPARFWSSENNPYGILVADLNGDGTDDVVTGNTDSPEGAIIFLALPHGTFVGESYTIDTIAPTVTGVYARGAGSGSANWNASFLAYLAANNLGDASLGYLLSTGTNQLRTLSWSNVNTISIRFSEEVVISQNDLSVVGSANGPAIPAITAFSWDSATHTGTWTFAAALPRGKFLLHIGGTVVDLAGSTLDGEWNVSSSTSSGNGAAGGDFNFRFNVLPGDFDGSNGVTITEVLQARNRAGKGTGSVGYTYREDMDGSGGITITEVLQGRNRAATSITGLNEPVAPGSTPQSPLELAPLIPGAEEGEYLSLYPALTEEELVPLVEEAIARWEASGLVPPNFDWSKLRFAITDLGPAYLGLGNPDGSILFDDDGAGWGWFLDQSPSGDGEFAPTAPDTEAAAHMDLLTVVMHEIGHALGYPTNTAQGTPAAALMSEFLGLGMRRTPGVATPAAVPSDLLAAESQAAPLRGFIRLANFDFAPLALGQVVGATTLSTRGALAASDDRLVANSLNDTAPNDGFIELLTVETESMADERVATESFGGGREAKAKRLDVAASETFLMVP